VQTRVTLIGKGVSAFQHQARCEPRGRENASTSPATSRTGRVPLRQARRPNMAPEKNVYIVDDDEASRDSIATLLSVAGFRTKSFASGNQFLQEVASLAPGCLVSDVRMPDLDGIALVQQLRTLKLGIRVVLITGHGDIKTAVLAIKSGAADFVEKPYDDETILAAVRRAQEELEEHDEEKEMAKTAARRLSSLSARECEVLERLVAGLPNKTIAHDLAISPRTVEFHRTRVMTKMEAGSLSQLVRLALLAGLKVDLQT
jgi:two-component system response regulator FixJ